MTPGERFAVAAIAVTVAALFVACALGSLAGWWAGAHETDVAADPHWLDEPLTEYEAAALWKEIEALERDERGSTSLYSVLVPVALFALGLLIVAIYR